MSPLKQEFKQSVTSLLPSNEATALIECLENSSPVVAIRYNKSKKHDFFKENDFVPWCHDGVYLSTRPQFTFDPLFHAGCYYVQDAASMFISHVIKQKVTRPARYLDLCAAPGGKTTAAIDALPQGSLVVANEVITGRARILADNMTKWGHEATIVTNDSPKNIGRLTHFFDVIAADVPCSGEGMMRKDEQAAAQWSSSLINECAERQRSIIDDIWQALKPEGLLIYSTCTFNREENENIIEYICDNYGATVENVPISQSWNIQGGIKCDFPCYRFFPHKTRGEGLFMAILRKSGGERKTLNPDKKTATKKSVSEQLKRDVSNCLSSEVPLSVFINNDKINVYPSCLEKEFSILRSSCRVIQEGIEFATIKGKKNVPSHSLAMSRLLKHDSFPSAELELENAVAYLRGEAIILSSDIPKGFVIVTFHNMPLGFANNLGNRANNLYPKALRILSKQIYS